jgi:hypothetical protein
MEGTVASEKKLVGTLSSGGTMTGGVATVIAKDGKDGISPIIEIEENVAVYPQYRTVTITDCNGSQSFDIFDGGDGRSAYDIACENGFEGTEEEWLASLALTYEDLTTEQKASLRGPRGNDGHNGTNGEDGYSVYYFRYYGIAIGTSEVTMDLVNNYASRIKQGDLLISAIGYLYEVNTIDKDRGFMNIKYLATLATKGEPGKDGTMTFEDLTDEQRESLRGEKGDKGDPGVYLGSGDMPEDCNVQIDPNGEPLSYTEIINSITKGVKAYVDEEILGGAW